MNGKGRGAIRGGKKLPIVHRAYRGPWEQFDARAYPKGAWVLHMIRRRLGDEAWWRAVNHYVKKHQHQCVETDQFRRAVEESTGRSFERFFHDWTGRPGNPVVRVDHKWHAKDKLMEVRVRQTQKEDAWHFPLTLEYRAKSSSVLARFTRDIAEKDLRFFVPLGARPALVRVDPDQAVLMELTEGKGRDLWKAQLLEDPYVIARMRAAQHFGNSRRPEDRKLLAEALGREPSWGVVGAIAAALGKTGGAVARDALLKGLKIDHPKARRPVVEALGKFRGDKKVLAALAEIVNKGAPSYNVEAAAIRTWARMRPDGALTTLKALLSRESHNDMIRQAVLSGMAEQGDVSVVGTLIEWTDGAKPRRTRTTAMRALSRLIETGDMDAPTRKSVLETVTACLDHREHRSVKSSAAQTLRTLGVHAAPAVEALQALADHDPNPRVQRTAQETIDKIQSGAEPRIQLQRLREELTKLRTANSAMQRRLERLEGKSEDNYKGSEGR